MWNRAVPSFTDPAGLAVLVIAALVGALAGFGLGAASCAAVAVWLYTAEVRALSLRMLDVAQGMTRDILKTQGIPERLSAGERQAVEAAMMDLGQRRERDDEIVGRMRHVLDGGRYDDSPTKWKKGKQP